MIQSDKIKTCPFCGGPTPYDEGEDEPAPPDVPEGHERWTWRDTEWVTPSDHKRNCTPATARYFEFLCPDGRWVFAPTPTIIWAAGMMWGYVRPGDDYQVLEARSAIVRKA